MDSSRCGRDVARYAVVRTSWVGTGSLASEQVVGRGGPAVEGPGDTFMPDIANAGRARQATLPASAPPSAWALVRAGRRRSLVWLAVAVAVSVLAACSPSPPDNGPPVDLQFEKYTLGNGLEVILREDHRVPTAAVNLWYHVGRRTRPGRNGFAHLFEHMMFQGSGHTGPEATHQLRPSAPPTSTRHQLDYTDYIEDVPSNRLELALWLESDRMGYLLDAPRQAAALQPAGGSAQRAPAEHGVGAVRAVGRGHDPAPSSPRATRTTARSSDRTPTSRPRNSGTGEASSALLRTQQRQPGDRRQTSTSARRKL